MFERHLYVGRRHPHPRQHKASVMMYRRGTWRYSKPRLSPDPPLTYSALVPLPLLVSAVVYHPSREYFLVPQAGHARSCSRVSIFLPRAASGDTSSACSTAATCLHLHPSPVVRYTRTRIWGPRPQTRPGTMRPPCPGRPRPGGPAQGLDLVAPLVDVEPSARYTLLRRPALPGFPASHACPDPIGCLRLWMRIS